MTLRRSKASGICLLVISFLSVIVLLLGPDKAQCGKTELKKRSKNQGGFRCNSVGLWKGFIVEHRVPVQKLPFTLYLRVDPPLSGSGALWHKPAYHWAPIHWNRHLKCLYNFKVFI